MSCCVIGTESLDQLEKMVIDMHFADIANKNVGRYTWKEHPYGPDQVQHKIEVRIYYLPVKVFKLCRFVQSYS